VGSERGGRVTARKPKPKKIVNGIVTLPKPKKSKKGK
jgi:hypothetical protein